MNISTEESAHAHITETYFLAKMISHTCSSLLAHYLNFKSTNLLKNVVCKQTGLIRVYSIHDIFVVAKGLGKYALPKGIGR